MEERIMKAYMGNQQNTPSIGRHQVRAGKSATLIKAIIIGIVFMGASFAGTVYADCPAFATNEDWYLSLGSPEQNPGNEYARTNRSSETIATSNNMEETWYLSLGSPEQRPDFGDARMDRPSETVASSNYMAESWYLSLGSPEQQPGFMGREQEAEIGRQVVC
jgi:hypothetical protein